MRLLILINLLICTACDHKRCDPEFPTHCHTESEWVKINKRNAEGEKCITDKIKKYGKMSDLIYNECGYKIIGILHQGISK